MAPPEVGGRGAAGRSLDVLRLEIRTAQPEDPSLESFVTPGSIIDAVSEEAVPPNLTGQRIAATVRLSTDTSGTRWWLKNLRVLP